MYKTGLTNKQVIERQKKYGPNLIKHENENKLIKTIKHIKDEPIYILLTVSAIIYFSLGEQIEGIIMIAFVIFVIALDLIQDLRTGNLLKKLREISQAKVKVIREGKKLYINSSELVPGDVLMVSEGDKISVDGILVQSKGLCVDESILTGESTGVWKNAIKTGEDVSSQNYCYAGTLVILGEGFLMAEKTGNETEYGKIGSQLLKTQEKTSNLQKQMNTLAKQSTVIAGVFFLLVSTITFYNLQEISISERIIQSALSGVVLALSMIPGEFPVMQSVFLSMGALRLAKKNALVRKLSSVETLGAVSILCVDKTGTITKNKMKVDDFITWEGSEDLLCRAVLLSCKEKTYDPIDKAILEYTSTRCVEKKQKQCLKACICASSQSKLIKEYVFTNELKAMGQVWQFPNQIIIGVKGASETILPLCNLPDESMKLIKMKINKMSEEGLRIILVGEQQLNTNEEMPKNLLECNLTLRGIIALSDPLKDNIKNQIKKCYKAGIRTIMITGDHPLTACSTAKKAGIKNNKSYITGEELSEMDDDELINKVRNCNVFARVLPIHKMRIVKAFQSIGEITAMTGDGVNDSSALKIADIGIAMGKSGTEVSTESADLVLLDDNFSTIVDSVKDGRRIYQNIVKAVGYVLAIHLPIALISLIAPLIGIPPYALFLLPLHIVLLELVMDPMCSFALERLPADDDILERPPRDPSRPLLNARTIIKSIVQGFVIFLVSFFSYYILLRTDTPVETARSFGYGILVLSNIFLVLENASDHEHIFRTIAKLKKEKTIWLVNAITIFLFILILYSPLARFLKLSALSFKQFLMMTFLALISVLWYEIIKLFKPS